MAVGADLVKAPIERQHLAVERVEYADAAIAVALEGGDGPVAVEHTGEERVDGGILEQLGPGRRAAARQQRERKENRKSSDKCHGEN